MNLFVKDLPLNMQKSVVKSYFSKYGEVKEVRIIDTKPQALTKIAFVYFGNF
jgi:RNA recognition motif-containing protein